METLRGIRYKLRMLGVPVGGPTYIYGDNMSVVNNTSKPESTAGLPISSTSGRRWDVVITRSDFKSETIFEFLSSNYRGQGI